jgi:Asp-tRNA(Asn)/Glu-tRNA(Gln) amidotransferase A subunit family amidase
VTDPCDLGAVEARRLIGARRLSPVELLDACIERIERVNPAVNAVTATAFERARDEARAAEAAAMGRGPLGPLHGLPVGIKDLEETEGLLTTKGSPIFRDYVPERDQLSVASLRAAGAIVLCKTNVPAFGAGANTNNPVWGPTRNPFDLARTCGGSSGGAAVALACHMMPLASGSDSGGSLRIPAAFCGVVSHRGSPGLVPSEKRPHGYTSNEVLGPMARSVDDMALMLSVMARYDPRIDPLSFEVPPGSFEAARPVDLSRLRVAVSEDLGATDVDDGIRETFRERIGVLAPSFATCDTVHPDFGEVRECYWTLRSFLFLSRYKTLYETRRDELAPNVVTNYEAGLELDVQRLAWATAEETAIYRRVQAFFADYDLLLCPSVAVPPFPVEQPYCDAINGKPLGNYLDWLALTWIITTTGNPVTNLPCGLDPTGTPFGIQLVGPIRGDVGLVRNARAIEAALAADPRTRRPVPDLAALAAAPRKAAPAP